LVWKSGFMQEFREIEIRPNQALSLSFSLKKGASTWARIYGGSKDDQASFIQQTQDGGYIVVGWTWSYGAGKSDIWVLKLDSNGNKLWDKTYGGSGGDGANSIQQTQDGGYIVAGWTWSFGGDIRVLKLDSNGNKLWDKTYGGSGGDNANSIQQTKDGGYIVAGWAESYGAGGEGGEYIWVLKLDSNGNKLWGKTYGGSKWDQANSIQQTQDGGYIVAGWTESYAPGTADILVLKLDSNGNKLWDKTYGGSINDEANSIQQTQDGGYIVAGWTWSYGAGGEDIWVLKLDSNGNKLWDKTYGGRDLDGAYSIQQTQDGGYIVAGWTRSYGAGESDIWVLKLDSNGNKLWDKTYGGSKWDQANSIQQTQDGGYIVAGGTKSYGAGLGDIWVLKLDSDGNCNGCF